MSLNEFELIKQYFARQAKRSSVIKSIGDDCAILSIPENQQLVLSMDTLVSGRHFPESATPYQIATRAMCTTVSDLAAMGATPLWFTLGLTLPAISEWWLAEFSRGLFDMADRFDMDLIGGDTTQGPLTITIQVHGSVAEGQVLRRDAAKIGDRLFVSNYIGDGAAALAVIQQAIDVPDDAKSYLLSRFYAPSPQIELGKAIAPFAHAAIDVSDGLLADAQHMADASDVGLEIDVASLPIHPYLQQCDSDVFRTWALTGGDDYQLLFTVSEAALPALEAIIKENNMTTTEIGRVVAFDKGVQCYAGGAPYTLSTLQRGYQHFTS
jgi:thiamine-monophosphate kinase